jgi:REP element-mobilizing transposase RayT
MEELNASLSARGAHEDEAAPLIPQKPRRTLPHGPPLWASADYVYFVTINCKTRGIPQLTLPKISSRVLEAAQFNHDANKWFIGLFLLMPDHLHALLSFPPSVEMPKVISNWKKYVSRTLAIEWQRECFDHRLRDENALRDKAEYIWQNPVRANLVKEPSEWPHVISNSFR